MTKVSLRVYNREIEGMIEASQLEEAIAHCQNILRTFPMYIETYRLIGKTFLEARRYGDAADIFQRALMAVPDDFVSHVGMSIIRDDEGKLDESIWHMERAFEIQPSNSAIQSELRRLYGRRDGVEPPKIRLSRDALANMYSQGELFNQAIAEIRAVLADDPNRPDLQVMLARAYYRAGQKVEAAEMAAMLLKKYPYCMDALRVLVDVLPGTKQGENTQIYRHRLGMLDPYSVFTKGSVFATDQVPDTAVSIERLDFKPGEVPVSTQPHWASSLGIQLESEKKGEGTPTWMQPGESAGGVAGPESAPSSSVPADKNDAVPEWMRAAGWQPSSGTSQEMPPVESETEPAGEPLAQAEIPDWLKPMAPAGASDNENAADVSALGPVENGEGEIPGWLKPMAPEEPGSGVEEAKPGQAVVPSAPENMATTPVEETDLPDWIKSMGPAAPADAEKIERGLAPVETPPLEAAPTEEAEIPDWLKPMAPAASDATEKIESGPTPVETPPLEAAPAEEAEIPDWLKPMAPAASAETEKIESGPAPVETPPLEAELEPAAEAEIPDWLKSLAPTVSNAMEHIQSEPGPTENVPTEAGPAHAEEVEMPNWLKSAPPAAAADTGKIEGEPAPAETQPAMEAGPVPAAEFEMPDWLKGAPPATVPELAKAEGEPAPAETPVMEAGPVPAAEVEMPDWLKSTPLAATIPEEKIKGESAPVESQPALEAATTPAQEVEMPDWLKAAPAAAAAETGKIEGEPAPAETPAMEAGQPPAEMADLPDWLKSLAPTAEAGPETNEPLQAETPEMVAKPEAALEAELPDWLKPPVSTTSSEAERIESEPALPTPPIMKAGAKPTEETAFPDWLKSLEPEAKNEAELVDTQPTPVVKILRKDETEPEEAGGFKGWLADLGEAEEPKAGLESETGGPVAPKAAEQFPAGEMAAEEQQPVSEAPVEPVHQEQAPPIGAVNVTDNEQFIPTGTVKPLDIGDDALGWLEGLAAKQGANPEELLTNPQERMEERPDWLTTSEPPAPEPAPSEPTSTEPPKTPLETLPLPSLDAYIRKDATKTPLETLPLRPIDILGYDAPPTTPPATEAEIAKAEEAVPPEPKAEEPAQPVKIEDDTMAWLEGLAANQGARPEELLTKPEERPAAVPEWVQNAAVEQPVPLAETPAEVEPEKSETVQPSAEKPEAVEVPPAKTEAPEPPLEEDITITTWLSNLDEETAGIEVPEEGLEEEEAHLAQEDLPDWLRDMEKPLMTQAPEAAAEVENDLPDWLRQPAEPPAEEEAKAQPVTEPAPEPAPEEGLPAWMEEPDAIAGQAAPTEPEEWIPAEEEVAKLEVEPAPELAVESAPLAEKAASPAPPPEEMPAQPPVTKSAGTLAPIPAHNKDAESLSMAQAALENNSLDTAIKEYGKLIKRGRLLDEVIHDLREATYRFPVDAVLWQTLGDAYMRANRLQDALDSYTKAEELLR